MKKILITFAILLNTLVFADHINNEIDSYKKSCENKNDIKGCFNYGYFFENGIAVKKDFKTAIKYYKIACNEGHYKACKNIGFIYSDGGFGIEKNSIISEKYFNLAKELKINSKE